MNNFKNCFSIIGLILSVCFSAIILYVLFGVINITLWTAALTFLNIFTFINLIVIIALACFGGIISKKCGTPALSVCWTVTGLYTIMQFVSTLIFTATIPKEEISHFYNIFNFVLIFAVLLITLPVLRSGSNHHNE